ncbi:MAG: hypothetical protein QJT81_02385 [Candidatus Thiothrix putei]|uniref:Uncharacterized protein n=1 Tax=Candidatus Thiothrix putei TaxID=3080811 RepID=A0AA95HET0_9GAMM|nr:MAG: hypothetical protein QJT81_02385 [Candidatus Thiothrix putei]
MPADCPWRCAGGEFEGRVVYTFDKLATQLYGCVNALSIPAVGVAGVSTINIINREYPELFKHLMRERSELLLQMTHIFHSLVVV